MELKTNKRKRKLHNNNAGMTLVEVVVAVAILSLVVIPVMKSITTAMYYNSKARARQDVSKEAECIMETFKGFNVEELDTMFQGGGIEGISAFSYIRPADLNAEPLKFGINDIYAGNGNIYDAEIILTKAAADEKLFQFDDVDKYQDAIFRGNRDWDTSAKNKAKNHFISSGHKDTFFAKFEELDERIGVDEITELDIDYGCLVLKERETVFTINNASGETKVTAKMIYRYRMEDHPYQIVKDPLAPVTDIEYEVADDEITYPFDGSYIEVEIPLGDRAEFYKNSGLKKLFLYYYPAYEPIKDKLVINNNASLDLDCYLIKQKATELSATSLELKEKSYQPQITGSKLDKINLLHNFGDNVATGKKLTPAPSITNSFKTKAAYTEADVVRKNKILAYNIELKIYDKEYFSTGSGNIITELSGTTTEKDKEY